MLQTETDVPVCPVCPRYLSSSPARGGREPLAVATLSPRLSPGPGTWQRPSRVGRRTSGRERWFCRLAVAAAAHGQRGGHTLALSQLHTHRTGSHARDGV